ncbi:MAG TPA: hypothetical protein EYN66_22190 [Myxococcales bacterium]|nr:hypothetical protein [Myxococcales bacterium]
MQSRPTTYFMATCLLLFVLAACSETPALPPVSNDIPVANDSDVGDSNDEGTAIDISGLLDTPKVEDIVTEPQCNLAPYPSGCACLTADECSEGFCVLTQVGQICVEPCIDTCPKGFTCTGTESGSDQIFLCLPRFAKLCQPCMEHLDCQSIGDPQLSLCLDYGTMGKFCGGYCESNSACPSGYHCENIDQGGDNSSQQCRKSDQTCACNQTGSSLNMKTECKITNNHGSCTGERFCSTSGLSACDAVPAAPEICDNKDNDCNEVIDDIGDKVPCQIENDYGACPGVLACVGGVGQCLGDVPLPELCDGFDNDCDGKKDEDYADSDGDGLADCMDPDDDGDEIPDELDNCPKLPNKDQNDLDDDGKGDLCDGDPDGDNFPGDSDCEPMDAQIYPGAEEKCNGKDDDCNNKIDDKVCDDGVACTFDFCDPVKVTCNHAPDPLACNDGNDCTTESCDLIKGCSSAPSDGNNCDDANKCTFGDTCNSGVCEGTPQGNCCLTADDCNDGNTCTTDLCDPAVGQCVHLMVADDTACNADNSGCTVSDMCKLGTCVSGPPVVCSGGSECIQTVCKSTGETTYLCNNILANADTLCDDGLYCTAGDHCDGLGQCMPGTSTVCNEPQGGCQLSLCNEAEKKCILISVDDTTPCNADKSGCTQDDTCLGGVCIPGPKPDCGSLDNGCIQGTCKSLGSNFFNCSEGNTPKGVSCDDGIFCTENEFCDGLGGCGGGAPKDCAKEINEACITGFCDEFASACKAINKVDGSPCDDSDFCTLGDSCDNGSCEAGDSSCKEEQINTSNNGGNQPYVAHLGSGRYVTQWTGTSTAPGDNYLRLSDAYGSRENEEEILAGISSTMQFPSRIGVGSGGEFLAVHWGWSQCQCNAYKKCNCDFGDVYARKYSYDGIPLAETKFDQNNLFVSANGHPIGTATTTDAMAVALGYSDGTWAVIKGEQYELTGPSPQLQKAEGEIRMVLLDSDLNVGNSKVLIPSAKLLKADYFDVCKRKNNTFLIASIGPNNSVSVYEFNQNGTPATLGASVIVGTSGNAVSGVRIACAQGNSNKFNVLWQIKEGNNTNIYLRRYSSFGTVTGPKLVASTSKTGSQKLGDAAFFSNGNFVVVYEQEEGDLDGSAIKAQRWTGSGAVQGPEIDVNTLSPGDQKSPGLAILSDNEWVVAYSDSNNRVFTRRFDVNGESLIGRPEIIANSIVAGSQQAPSASISGTGNILISYHSPVPGKEDNEILARIVNTKGELVGSEFQINSYTPGDQHDSSTAGASNRLAVTWVSSNQDSEGDGVYLRLLDGKGTFVSPETLVNKTTSGNQYNPDIAVTDTGNTVVVWEDENQAKSPLIHSRRFDPEGNELTGILKINDGEAQASAPCIETIPSNEKCEGAECKEAFLVAWESGNAVSAINVRKIGYGGLVWSEQLKVNSTEIGIHKRPTLAISNDGLQAALCWDVNNSDDNGERNTLCRLIETTLMTTVSNEFSPHVGIGGVQWRPSLTTLATGDYLVAWSAEKVDSAESAIHYRRITSDGTAAGPRVVANRYWDGNQTLASIVSAPGGSFLVSWQSFGKDGDENGISMRMLPPP